MVILGFFDTLMIGQYGTKELAACSFVIVIINLPMFALLGFSTGIIPISGTYFGRGDKFKVGEIFKNSVLTNTTFTLLMLLILVIVYFFLDKMGQPKEILSYIKSYYIIQLLSFPFICIFFSFKQFTDSITKTKVCMNIIIIGNLLNILLNYLLIYGKGPFPELGLNGAGLATLISKIFMAGYSIYIFNSKKWANEYKKGFIQGHFIKRIINSLFRIGTPSGIQVSVEALSWALLTFFVGWLGTISLAAHQVIMTFSSLSYMLYAGIGGALAVLVSKYDRNTERDKIRLTSIAGTHLMFLAVFICCLLIFLFRYKIGFIFSNDNKVIALTSTVIVPLILYQLGDGMQLAYVNLLRGIGNVKSVIPISIIFNLLITIIISYIGGILLKGGLFWLWFGFFPGLSLTAGLYASKFYKTLKTSKQI